MLPDETVPDALLAGINAQFPCRVPQLQRLSALIGDEDDPSPPSIIVHGLEATGKSLVVRAFLEAAGCRFAWVPCNECVTARHLTQRIAAAAMAMAAAGGGGGEVAGRCDGVGALAVMLAALLLGDGGDGGDGGGGGGGGGKYFLVLDRIDQQRELTPTLLAGLGRLGEMIPNLTVIFIVTVSKARLLSSAEVPHIHFTPYTKDESIKVLSKYVRRITKLPTTTAATTTTAASGEAAAATETEDEEEEEDEYTPEAAAEELYVWEKFCGTVWDSLAKGAARDIVQFRDAVESMWDQFVQPIAHGQYGTRNFSQLYLLQKEMFRRESSIVTSVVAVPAAETTRAAMVVAAGKNMHDLPYYSKYLLCAAYLASYNPSRQDVAFFTKSGDFKKKRRGGGGGGGKGRPAKTRKIHRRLLGPQAWPLERMLAIFYAILPHPINSSVDLQTQIATLTSLRLLTKASVTDALEASTKWRVNVGWDYIRGVARSVKFDIEDFVAE